MQLRLGTAANIVVTTTTYTACFLMQHLFLAVKTPITTAKMITRMTITMTSGTIMDIPVGGCTAVEYM